MSLLIRAATIVTCTGEKLENGWLLSEGGEIKQIGTGPPPEAEEHLHEPNCVAMPGLVNAHDHMYQWATRGYEPDGTLFEWLTTLYPVWAHLDAELVRFAARAAMAKLLLSGCTLSTDHHYVFPAGRPGIFAALVESARELGLRFHPCRGSMSLGHSQGGLPPDHLVEQEDHILADTEAMIARYHDPAPGSMCRLVVAPCSPFSVSPQLMRESAELARRKAVRLHTHLAETLDEQRFCQEKFGRRPLELMEELGWTGPDVWYAHCIHLTDGEVQAVAAKQSGIVHCPSSNLRLGAGACRVEDLLAAGVRVGLGVDGAASNEDSNLAGEVHEALFVARLRAALQHRLDAPHALSAQSAWRLASAGGAACLGRDDCGTLEVGKRADVALFRLDGLAQTGIADPLVALALAPPARAESVVIEGRVVVREGQLETGDERAIAADLRQASERLRELSGV
ncbi:MAG: 8-oxoguanine deaminase [Candidatus Dormibacteraeota bacterium]|uniref:8-oxoguanine deaminase n=1 Tax=Candidatus Dormiibacter inghamiae TaxID=3127013 RepID=A0A934NCT1_9BACT|nr:8-oxoguanine deaminase [Candidatus Dormibacteraeota bacterium]MBJ7605011.1 8-oxoguanine deaminase [Candidatus Dormibacteraeota bacterium]